MKTHREQIEVEVVVGGHPQKFCLFLHKQVCDLVRTALHGVQANPYAEIVGWTLRDRDAREFSNAARIGESGIEDGAVLFLDRDVAGCSSVDWFEMALRLCDDAGQVSRESVVDNPMPVEGESYLGRHERLSGKSATEYPGGWPCTGHAHYNGPYGPLHITCTSSAHRPHVPAASQAPAKPKRGGIEMASVKQAVNLFVGRPLNWPEEGRSEPAYEPIICGHPGCMNQHFPEDEAGRNECHAVFIVKWPESLRHRPFLVCDEHLAESLWSVFNTEFRVSEAEQRHAWLNDPEKVSHGFTKEAA